jgi:hypothetical protein
VRGTHQRIDRVSARSGDPIPNSGREGHQDGTSPREVQWFGTGRVTLVFPGPDTHIEQAPHHTAAAGQPG